MTAPPTPMSRVSKFQTAALAEYRRELAEPPGSPAWAAARATRIRYYRVILSALDEDKSPEALDMTARLTAELRGIEADRVDCLGLTRAAAAEPRWNDRLPF